MHKFPIQITFDFDENEYIVFVKGINLEGRGNSEAKAILDFFNNYEQLNEKMLDTNFVKSMIQKLEGLE